MRRLPPLPGSQRAAAGPGARRLQRQQHPKASAAAPRCAGSWGGGRSTAALPLAAWGGCLSRLLMARKHQAHLGAQSEAKVLTLLSLWSCEQVGAWPARRRRATSALCRRRPLQREDVCIDTALEARRPEGRRQVLQLRRRGRRGVEGCVSRGRAPPPSAGGCTTAATGVRAGASWVRAFRSRPPPTPAVCGGDPCSHPAAPDWRPAGGPVARSPGRGLLQRAVHGAWSCEITPLTARRSRPWPSAALSATSNRKPAARRPAALAPRLPARGQCARVYCVRSGYTGRRPARAAAGPPERRRRRTWQQQELQDMYNATAHNAQRLERRQAPGAAPWGRGRGGAAGCVCEQGPGGATTVSRGGRTTAVEGTHHCTLATSTAAARPLPAVVAPPAAHTPLRVSGVGSPPAALAQACCSAL
jgi:hypothetical protein